MEPCEFEKSLFRKSGLPLLQVLYCASLLVTLLDLTVHILVDNVLDEKAHLSPHTLYVHISTVSEQIDVQCIVADILQNLLYCIVVIFCFLREQLINEDLKREAWCVEHHLLVRVEEELFVVG